MGCRATSMARKRIVPHTGKDIILLGAVGCLPSRLLEMSPRKECRIRGAISTPNLVSSNVSQGRLKKRDSLVRSDSVLREGKNESCQTARSQLPCTGRIGQR